ncbi:MAG: ATP-binding protein [Fimbriimonadaceae bacterium]|nr:ATP-binding protein [Fimbriimonadaceae bacterium]
MSAAPRWNDEGLWSLFDLSPMFQAGTERYLQASLDRCAEWFRASGASIFLAEDPDQVMRLKAKAGRQTRIPGDATINPGEGLAGQVVQLGEARLIQEDRSVLRLAGDDGQNEIASSMIVPLIDPRQGVIGVLNLSRSRQEPPFNVTDLDQARAMAAQVTLAVTNARLVERLNDAVRLSRESRERLAAVIDSVPGGVIVTGPEGELISASPWALNEGLFGGPADRSGGRLEQEIRSVIEASRGQAQPLSRTVHDSRADRTWMLQTQPMSHGGMVISVQEITEHERSQREVHRLSRLAEIGRMTAAIAHEIRNPLTGIRSAAQMIQSSPELGTEFGRIIEEETLKLNTLCTEFLEFAKPLTLAREDVDLDDLASRIVGLLLPEAERRGLTLSLKPESGGRAISADPRRLDQVLHNLIRNGMEATAAGGEVCIRTWPNGFEVSDTGEGMSPEAVEKLFSPFFTSKPQGTGLGLCMVEKIIEAHNGSIQVRSELGSGAVFTVHLAG